MFKNRCFSCLISLILVIFLSARTTYAKMLPSQNNSEKGDANKIGVLLPLSGKLAPFGQTILNGIELAVMEENEISGIKKTLVIRDTEGNTDLAVIRLRELIEDERVIAVIGPVLSKTALACARAANELKTPLINPAASAAKIPSIGPYVFRNCLTPQNQVESLVEFAMDKMRLSSFAILHPDNPYGRELADIFTEQVQKRKGNILGRISYPPQDADFREQIGQIHKIGPQALFLPDYYDKIMQIAPQMAFYYKEEYTPKLDELIKNLPPRPTKEPLISEPLLPWEGGKFILDPSPYEKPGLESSQEPPDNFEINLKRPKIYLLGGHGWYNPQLLREGQRYLEGAVFSCGFFSQGEPQTVRDFMANYQNKYGKEPELLTAQGYDNAKLLLEVLRAGAKSRQEVRDALEGLEYFEGVTGAGYFNSEREMQKKLVMAGIAGGKFIPLKGYEPWLLARGGQTFAPLFNERLLEEYLPEELYLLLYENEIQFQ